MHGWTEGACLTGGRRREHLKKAYRGGRPMLAGKNGKNPASVT